MASPAGLRASIAAQRRVLAQTGQQYWMSCSRKAEEAGSAPRLSRQSLAILLEPLQWRWRGQVCVFATLPGHVSLSVQDVGTRSTV